MEIQRCRIISRTSTFIYHFFNRKIPKCAHYNLSISHCLIVPTCHLMSAPAFTFTSAGSAPAFTSAGSAHAFTSAGSAPAFTSAGSAHVFNPAVFNEVRVVRSHTVEFSQNANIYTGSSKRSTQDAGILYGM